MFCRYVTRTIAVLAVALITASAFGQSDSRLDEIRDLRLKGRLDQACSLAERYLSMETSDDPSRIKIHLEMARILDRIGLHTNSRPVQEALVHLEIASDLAQAADANSRAEVSLGLAEFHYRAGIADGDFDAAIRHARQADSLFAELGHYHGRADAVHRLGLIHLQNRELEDARRLFDESLRLDVLGGPRVFFRGEYERHVGFVYLLEGDTDAAILYFERSLAARREIGALDPSLFAAAALASALVDVGRTGEARPYLLFAISAAEAIESPVGLARAGLALGRLFEIEGDTLAADAAFRMTLRSAESVGYESVARRARDAIAR